MSGFVPARLSAVAPVILAAALFAIPTDEAQAGSGHPGGNYALHCAAGDDNNLAAVIHLLGNAHGKNVNERNADSGYYRCSFFARRIYSRRDTPLHHAASHGHATIVATLIVAGADVNAKNNGGQTPLHKAADRGHAPVVSILIAAGADVNAKNNDGETPLYRAAQGNAPVVSILIAARADADAKNNDGETPLHRAAAQGNVPVISILIAAGADVNAKNNDGETPLYETAYWGRASVASVLIAAGGHWGEVCANEFVVNPAGYSPPCVCPADMIINGECGIMTVCDSPSVHNPDTNGCDCPEPNIGENGAAMPGNCQTPSAEICMGLNPPNFYDTMEGECVENCGELVPPKFENSATGECNGYLQPCHATAVRKDDNSGCECPERSFSHDPSGGSWRRRHTEYCIHKTNGNRRHTRFPCLSFEEYREYEWYEFIPDSAECFADHAPVAHYLGGWNSAIRANNPTIVAHFIAEHNQDPDSGIHSAARYDSHFAASVMIENGANVDYLRRYTTRTPLHDAVRYGATRMISFLLSANANPDAMGSGGNTPLHFAAEKTDAPETAALISLLLAGGANPNIRNNNDWHPLDLAYHGGRIRLSNGVFARTPKRLLMSALVAGGGTLAQPDGQDGNGDSPLHFETRAGRDEFVLWILNRGANPDIANNKSETPMHHAAGDFSLPRVKLLAERGANPDKQDEDGDSPLHKISRGTDTANNTALISLLLDKGANPNLKNNDGWRPLDLAFDDGGARDPRFARRMLMLALIEGGAQWTSECSGGAIPNENYRGLAQVATYPECKCPSHISQRNDSGACECPGHSHSQVNGRCLPQGSAEVDAEIAKMQVELARLRAALVSLNARLSLSAEAPRETVEDIAEQARETAAEIDWRRANFVALGRRAEAGEAPPPVALSDTAAECRMRGGEVRIDSGSGTRICLGLDRSGTFCLVDSGDAFPCRGLFKHVRRCNDVYHRPALNAFICGARCGADETARGKGCE